MPLLGAATVCFLWHYAFTFAEEVELIWKRGRWDFSLFAYLWTRYITLGSLLLGVYGAWHHVLKEPRLMQATIPVTSPARPHLNDFVSVTRHPHFLSLMRLSLLVCLRCE